MLTIVLPGEEPKSYNKILRMNRWDRNAEAQAVKQLVASYVPEGTAPFREQVDICILGYYQGRRRDGCNIPAKFFIDGLLGRVIKNDSPVYVRSVTTLSRRGEPRTVICVKPVNEPTHLTALDPILWSV